MALVRLIRLRVLCATIAPFVVSGFLLRATHARDHRLIVKSIRLEPDSKAYALASRLSAS